MGIKRVIATLTFLIIAIIFCSTVFVVTEGQKAVLLRLGKIIRNPITKHAKIYNPGLHFKCPIICNVKKFDIRLQTIDTQSSRILTANQKYVLVDYYVKWYIKDLVLYYTRTGGNIIQAEYLLQQQINDVLRAQFGLHNLSEVISDDRTEIMLSLNKFASKSAAVLGIGIVDVRIKQIDLPKEVSEKVYSRMRSDRAKVAAKYRATGESEAEIIKATADADVTIILSKAKAEAAKIYALGDQQASEVYAKAYQKNAAFYDFYRTLQIYKNIFKDREDSIILNPNLPIFKYFINPHKMWSGK